MGKGRKRWPNLSDIRQFIWCKRARWKGQNNSIKNNSKILAAPQIWTKKSKNAVLTVKSHKFFNLSPRCPGVVPELSRRCPGDVPGDVPETFERTPKRPTSLVCARFLKFHVVFSPVLVDFSCFCVFEFFSRFGSEILVEFNLFCKIPFRLLFNLF